MPKHRSETDAILIPTLDVLGLLSISMSHFYDLQARGLIGPRPTKLGAKVLWRKSDILAWIEARCPTREEWQAQRGGGS